MTLFRIAVIVVSIGAANSALATSYKVTILHPMGFNYSIATSALGGHQLGWGNGALTGDQDHALLWSSEADSYVDLHPAGFERSYGQDLTKTYQVGTGVTGLVSNALMWSGTPESVVNLHPAGFDRSAAVGASGDFQVGSGSDQNNFNSKALLWNGTAESVVNLHPAGFGVSMASDISGGSQVGSGLGASGSRALLWHSTAENVVNLHPPEGYTDSFATGVSGGSQVGYGIIDRITGNQHALLWHGTAESFVSLNPVGFDSSTAFDIAGDRQVGVGSIGPLEDDVQHALLWAGTAVRVVDLHSYLEGTGIEFFSSSAFGIDESGSIAGVAYERVGEFGSRQYAVLWTPVPEPTMTALAFCAILGATALPYRSRPTYGLHQPILAAEVARPLEIRESPI